MTSGSRRSSPGRPDLVRPRSLSQDLEELRAGRIEAGDRLRSVCDRVAAVDRVVHAFVVDAGRRGRVLAEADRPGDRSGIGVGVKDVIRVDALPTTAGSSLPVAELAGPQASVARLRAAGASVVGKTVSAEFAVAAPGPPPTRTIASAPRGAPAADRRPRWRRVRFRWLWARKPSGTSFGQRPTAGSSVSNPRSTAGARRGHPQRPVPRYPRLVHSNDRGRGSGR